MSSTRTSAVSTGEQQKTSTNTLESSVNKQLTNKHSPETSLLYSETGVLGIRIPLYYKHVYMTKIANSKVKRRLLREIVINAIRNLADLDIEEDREEDRPVIVNMPVSVSISKAEARPEINIDLSSIRDMLRDLLRTIADFKKAAVHEYELTRLGILERKIRKIMMVVRN